LVIDDFHLVAGTEAERACERLLHYVCADVHIALGTRRTPGFDLSRLRVAEALLELGPDELRFRAWEVEQLFRNYYGTPLPPEELAELSRRSGGWAAGLQLFHLATHDKSATERRRILRSLAQGPRVLRDYLFANVLGELPDELRVFLLETCVLGVLTVPLCDALAPGRNAAARLAELERRHLCTCVDEAGTYRYHEVLRAHLEGSLVERYGEAEVARRYSQAGCLLERQQAAADALVAYARAGDGAAVSRVLGNGGPVLVATSGDWLDLLPRGLIQDDPWCLLASARRHALAGRLVEGIAAYHDAEERLVPGIVQETCRRERLAIAAFLQSTPPPAPAWIGLLRAATTRDPLGAAFRARELTGPIRPFVVGVAYWLAGYMRDARTQLAQMQAMDDGGSVLSAAAQLLEAHAYMMSTVPGSSERRRGLHFLEVAISGAEDIGAPLLSRLGERLLTAARGSVAAEDAAVTRAMTFDPVSWPWALGGLLDALAMVSAGSAPTGLTDGLALRFHELGAGTLEAWAEALHALACVDEAEKKTHALAADNAARSAGVPGARALALLALGEADPSRAHEHIALAQSLAEECGFHLPQLGIAALAPSTEMAASAWLLRCFGHFEFVVADRRIDLSMLRPRARSALRFLAAHVDQFVHRETLVSALWPSADLAMGTHQLQVAISSLRRVLEPGVERDGFRILVREGDAYCLALHPDAVVDTRDFERAIREARERAARNEIDEAIESLRRALVLYRGDLLVEEGSTEWVIELRAHFNTVAADAATTLAELLLGRGEAGAAAAAAEWGLRVDGYRDELWRALIAAHESNGDTLAAGRARNHYAARLDDLGILLSSSSGTPAR
jgi:DNA-binding SARP family transcriptional activator